MTLPGARKRLFSDKLIKRPPDMVEYQGQLAPWSMMEKTSTKGFEGDAFYIFRTIER